MEWLSFSANPPFRSRYLHVQWKPWPLERLLSRKSSSSSARPPTRFSLSDPPSPVPVCQPATKESHLFLSIGMALCLFHRVDDCRLPFRLHSFGQSAQPWLFFQLPLCFVLWILFPPLGRHRSFQCIRRMFSNLPVESISFIMSLSTIFWTSSPWIGRILSVVIFSSR